MFSQLRTSLNDGSHTHRGPAPTPGWNRADIERKLLHRQYGLLGGSISLLSQAYLLFVEAMALPQDHRITMAVFRLCSTCQSRDHLAYAIALNRHFRPP